MIEALPNPEEEEDPNDKRREAIVDRALNELSEHFEAVHIIGCYSAGDKSARYAKGRGNWFTRYGMIKDWVLKEEESD